MPADLLIAAKGARPNLVPLTPGDAPAAGLPVDGHMRTASPDVYAAGDVAVSMDAVSGRPRAFTTWPSACRQGHVAGTLMAGGTTSIESEVAFNIVPIFGTSAAFIGETAEATSTEGTESIVWHGSRAADGLYRRLYLRGDRVVGASLIGHCRDAGLLKHLVETGEPVTKPVVSGLLAGRGWGAAKGLRLPRL